jgi:hypothetical protein
LSSYRVGDRPASGVSHRSIQSFRGATELRGEGPDAQAVEVATALVDKHRVAGVQ